MKTFYPELFKSLANRKHIGFSRFSAVFMAMIMAWACPAILFGQAPLPSYSGPQTYAVNTAITLLSPSNSGGAVAAPGYSSSRTTVFSGTAYSGPMVRDAAGNIYTTDFSAPSDVLLVKISAVPGTPNVTLQDHVEFARDLIMDAAGNLYAAEAAGIYKWTPGSTSGSLVSSFQAADGIAIDASGNIYATTYAPGSFITEIAAGSGQQTYFASGLSYDTGIAIDAAGNLYVCDNGTSSIIKIAAGTQTLTTVASGLSNDMNDMVCDNAGNLFFSEANSTGVLEILAGTGTPVAVGSHYSAPYGIKPDASGNLYILDNGSLYKIAPVGGYFISPALPAGLSFNGTTGAISGTPTAISAATNYSITGWNSSGHNAATVNIAVVSPPLPTYSGPQNYTVNTAITPLSPSNSGGAVAAPGYSGSKSTIFSGTSYVVFDRDASGNLYAFDYSNTSNKKLVKLSSTGSVLATYLTFLSRPEDIEVDAAGNIFALDGSTLYKITSGGTVSTLSSSLFNANGLALDAADNVYVAEYNTSLSSVIEMPADGSSTINIGSGLSFMTDVAVDAAGNVYVCNDGDASIKEIPAGGGSMITIASGFTSFNTSDLTNIIVDSVGDIFFTERNGAKVSEIPAGTNTPVLISSGYFAPAGLALDLAGNLYIGDNGSLYKVAPIGGYFISPALPAGLSFDTTTGIISGTPTALSAATAYNITASNSIGSHTTQVTIAVSNAVLSSDAKLSNLTIQHGTLSPPFDPATFSYTVNLPNSITGVTLVPTTDDAGATMVTYGGAILSGATSASVPLAVGTNTDHIIVTAADGVTKNVYAISFVRADTVLTTVNSIAAAGPTTTNVSTVNYSVTFGSALSGLTAANFSLQTTGTISGAAPGTPTTADGGTTWTVPVNTGTGDGDITLQLANASNLSTGISTSLPFGTSAVTIDKTVPTVVSFIRADPNPSNETGLDYQITFSEPVTGVAASDFTTVLSGVTASSIGVSPSSSTVYNLTVNDVAGDGTVQVKLNAGVGVTDLAGNSTVTDFNSEVFNIEQTPPSVKSIIATSPSNTAPTNSATLTYTAIFSVPVSGVSNDDFTLTTTSGSVSYGSLAVTPVSGSIYTVEIDGVSGNGTVRLDLNGSGTGIFDLAGNAITGGFTGGDTYTIDQLAPALAGLTLSNGTLSPVFSSTVTGYTAAVGNGLANINITPTVNDPNATMIVNGTTATSGSPTAVPLVVGVNTIPIVVTALDGSTQKTYTITITEAKSLNNNLASIKTSAGLAQGATVPSALSESVVNSVTSLTVIPTVADPTATVTVNNVPVTSGNPSASIPLNVGQNTITIIITAQDTKTKTYTLTVTRAPSANTNLANLVLSKGTLAPAFGTPTNYLDYVANGIQLTVTPTLANLNATLTINGTAATSGTATAVPIIVGNNTITIVVTAQDKSSTKTYTVVVNEARSPNNTLFSFKTSGGLAKGQTVPTTLTENVPNAESTITVTPTVVDANATVTVNNAKVISGQPSASIPLNVGDNTITTIVTAQNGTTLTYILTVTRAGTPGQDNAAYQPISVDKPTGEAQLADDGINVHQGVSPNGDGINDFLQIDNISQYPDNNLKIMNRNGQLVYEAKGYDNATKTFDGHSNKNGQMQLPGTYFFQLDYTLAGIVKHKTGYLVLKY